MLGFMRFLVGIDVGFYAVSMLVLLLGSILVLFGFHLVFCVGSI